MVESLLCCSASYRCSALPRQQWLSVFVYSQSWSGQLELTVVRLRMSHRNQAQSGQQNVQWEWVSLSFDSNTERITPSLYTDVYKSAGLTVWQTFVHSCFQSCVRVLQKIVYSSSFSSPSVFASHTIACACANAWFTRRCHSGSHFVDRAGWQALIRGFRWTLDTMR